ncbi:MAG: cell division protein FtsZ, partial [Candidatus Angelobacter sp.]|nr:cell division protein FtsZ [Candidatus Angelobacter sp.]
FADVKTIMAGMGYAVMGTAVAKGERRATDAAQAAISSPLLEAGAIDGARGILINITGSSSLKLAEVNEASTIIQSAAHEDANIIFGAVQDEKMKDDLKITVIATGFKNDVPARKDRTVNATQAAISTARTASAYHVQAAPATPRVVNGSHGNGSHAQHAAHAAHAVAPTRVVAPTRESPNLATMTESIRSAVEQDDLDVPAFIRKRGEIN